VLDGVLCIDYRIENKKFVKGNVFVYTIIRFRVNESS